MKNASMKAPTTKTVVNTTPAAGQPAKAKAKRRHSSTNRSENDDEDYEGSDFSNEDYNARNFKDEDDYNSGKLGRGAEATSGKDIKDIPRRKYEK